ncbi:hypothetical protein DFO66_103366 [Brevibacterium sanguinis]|uniref:Uncharacterized protein n=2 Tax=Brevibacterium TaxID=1696 RepID=A0A366IMH5_9MICO|nr:MULTISPECIES: hypothetical protein [Brevibacterium]RBP66419.1 hypothetical protein DFO66_103366 [Brevibacterium sanguinis]RBP73071.1 hypothetical protein DFO65_103366 [Brevibacterium celere]
MTDPAHIRRLCDSIHDALALAEHPPSSSGTPSGGVGQSRPPIPTTILSAKEDLKAKLVSWARMIGEDGEFVIDCDDDTLSIAAWVYTKADWLADHPAADDFVDEIDECVRALRRPYASKEERFLVTVMAGVRVYAYPWERTVLLPDGTVGDTYQLRQELYQRTRKEILPAANVSAVLDKIFGMEVSADAIRKAAKRGTLEKRPEGFLVERVIERFGLEPKHVAI